MLTVVIMKILILLSIIAVISAEKTGDVSTALDSTKTRRFERPEVAKVPKYRRSLTVGGLDPIFSNSGFASSSNVISGLQTQQIPNINQNLFDFQPSFQTLSLSTLPQTINYQSSPSTFAFPSSTIPSSTISSSIFPSSTIPSSTISSSVIPSSTISSSTISSPTFSTFPNTFGSNFASNPIVQSNFRFNTNSQLTVPQPIFSGLTSPIQSFVPNDFSTVSTQVQPFQNLVSKDFSTGTYSQIQPIQNFIPNDFSTLTQIYPNQNFIPNDFNTFTTQVKPYQNFLSSDFTSKIQPLQNFVPNDFISGFSEISSKPPVFKPLGVQQSFRPLR